MYVVASSSQMDFFTNLRDNVPGTLYHVDIVSLLTFIFWFSITKLNYKYLNF